MSLFNELAASDALRLDHVLEPGEIQLLSNHTVLHSRSSFEDWDDVDSRRHLLRLWLAPEVDRPLPDAYTEIYGGSVQVRPAGVGGELGWEGGQVASLVGGALGSEGLEGRRLWDEDQSLV